MQKGKFLVMARMVRCDHGAGRYEFENPISSQWGAGTIFVLANAIDFKGMLDDFTVADGFRAIELVATDHRRTIDYDDLTPSYTILWLVYFVVCRDLA